MDRKPSSRIKHIDFIIIDLLALELSFIASYLLRFSRDFDTPANYTQLNIYALLIYIVLIFIIPFHSGILKRGHFTEFYMVLFQDIAEFAAIILLLFALQTIQIHSRIFVGTFFLLNLFLQFLARVLWKKFVIKRMGKSGNKIHVIIVTYRENAQFMVDNLTTGKLDIYQIDRIMLLDKDNRYEPINGIKVVYRNDIAELLRTHIVDEVFIGSKTREIKDTGRLISWFLSMGIAVHVMSDIFINDVPNMSVDKIGNMTYISSTMTPITPEQKAMKRVADIFVSIIGLILTGIFFIIFAPIIVIQSPGPVFFKQTRVGLNGRKFTLYKFRSMEIGADEKKADLLKDNEVRGQMFKITDDPRIIPIGRFLRKTSIDEFPQFLNILKGDMSLVGTRPPTLDEFEHYRPDHMSRLAMKPGLTGMWQISGRSEIKDFEEVCELDRYYISNFSIPLDMEIILKTIKVVLTRKGV